MITNKIYYGFIKSFAIGAILGFIILYFRGIKIAPFLCGIGATLFHLKNYKKI